MRLPRLPVSLTVMAALVLAGMHAGAQSTGGAGARVIPRPPAQATGANSPEAGSAAPDGY